MTKPRQDADIDLIRRSITTIADYPKAGIQFRDITSLLEDPAALNAVIEAMLSKLDDTPFDKVLALEARGFPFGAILAHRLGLGLVLARKPGKLPRAVYREAYALEYGEDALEIHQSALEPGDRVLLVDDLLATGGTALAAFALARKAGATVSRACFVVALPELNGLVALKQVGIEADYLVEYDGE